MSTSKARHPIHVAVMRLFKPPFRSEPTPPVPTLRSEMDLGNTFSLSGLLTLPENPGETYLGQHFNAFVRITNTHSRPLKSVKLTVELVTPRVRHVFTDKREKSNGNTTNNTSSNNKTNKNQPVELAVDDGLDIVIEHLLVEQGTHRLRVTVSYVWPETGASETCVKQYPVRVERPISVNLRTRTTQKDTTLVEAQLQNTTSENVLLDTVRFVPAAGFQSNNLGIEMKAEDHACLDVVPLESDEIGCVGSVIDNAVKNKGYGDSKQGSDGSTNSGTNGDKNNTTTTTTTNGTHTSSTSLLERIIRRQSNEQERILLRPSQVHQYLFQVKEKQNQKEQKEETVAESKVGRISMVWKTTMGETAKLQTALIERDVPSKKGLELSLISTATSELEKKSKSESESELKLKLESATCPTTMLLSKRYRLVGQLTNHTSLSTSVRIDFGGKHQMGGIVVCGW